jgi:hypothetical protein
VGEARKYLEGWLIRTFLPVGLLENKIEAGSPLPMYQILEEFKIWHINLRTSSKVHPLSPGYRDQGKYLTTTQRVLQTWLSLEMKSSRAQENQGTVPVPKKIVSTLVEIAPSEAECDQGKEVMPEP